MALNQNDLIRAKEIVSSMDEEQKVMFIQKYETLNEQDKETAITRLLEFSPQQDLRSKGIVFATDEGGMGMGAGISPTHRQSAIGTAIQAIPGAKETIKNVTDFGSEYGKVVAKTLDARYTLGATKLILEQINPREAEKIFGEQETLIGKTASAGGQLWGMATGTGIKIAGKAAGKVVPKLGAKGAIGLAGAAPKEVAKRKAVVAFNKIARGALTGGIEGTVQINPFVESQENIKDQALVQAGQGAFGIVAGAVTSTAGIGLTRAGRSWKQMIRKSKTPAITKIIDKTKSTYEETSKFIKSKVKGAGERVSRLTSRAKTDVAGKIKLEKEYVDNTLNQTTKLMNETVEALDDALVRESASATTEIQSKLPEFYSKASSAYGQRIDEISEAIAKSNNKITNQEINQFLDVAEQQLDEAFITSGPARESIKMLREKYARDVVEEVPFKQIFNDLKNVTNSMSVGARSGTKIYSESDLGVSIVKDSFGDIIAKRSPEFAELQRSYAPVARLKRKSNQFFKPFSPEFEKNRGTKAIYDIAQNKGLKIDEENLIKAIEEGTDFIDGVGPITKDAIEIGERLSKAKANVKIVTDGIKKTSANKQQLLDEGLTNRLKMLTNREDFLVSNYQAQQEMIETVFNKRMKDLGVRQELISNLKKDAGRFKKMRQIAVGGAIGATASYGAMKIIHSILGSK